MLLRVAFDAFSGGLRSPPRRGWGRRVPKGSVAARSAATLPSGRRPNPPPGGAAHPKIASKTAMQRGKQLEMQNSFCIRGEMWSFWPKIACTTTPGCKFQTLGRYPKMSFPNFFLRFFAFSRCFKAFPIDFFKKSPRYVFLTLPIYIQSNLFIIAPQERGNYIEMKRGCNYIEFFKQPLKNQW